MKRSLCIITIIISMICTGANNALAANLEIHVYGWAWSDTTGWIKLHSCNDYDSNLNRDIGCDSGISYGVTSDALGNLSGYAWSSNVGWISFSPNSCGAGPKITPLVTAADGTISSYKMTGVAQVVSVTQSPWTSAVSHGGYNGCVYLDSASLPSNPCAITSNVQFARAGDNATIDAIYTASGAGWSAGGSTNASTLCTNAGSVLHAWGGLSWIRMSGFFANAKIVVVDRSPKILTLSVKNWNPECTNTSKVTLSWTTKNATSCSMKQGAKSPVSVVINGESDFTVGRGTGQNFLLECWSTLVPERATKTILAGTCTQCTDAIDNDKDNTIDEDDLSCHVNFNRFNTFLPSNNESGNTPCTNKTDPSISPYCPDACNSTTDPTCVKKISCKVGDPGYPNCPGCKVGDPGYPDACPVKIRGNPIIKEN